MRDRTSDSPAVPTDVVRARRFELVDDSGRVRAVLGNLARDADAEYWPGLTLRNALGATEYGSLSTTSELSSPSTWAGTQSPSWKSSIRAPIPPSPG